MLSDKDRELISIGASMAAGCQPCTNFHLQAAGIAGASDAEIGQAVNHGLRVRRHASEVMAQIADQLPGRPMADTFAGQESSLMAELISISAAYAVSSVPDLETHIIAAQGLDATKGEILSAIKIARAVRGIAESKVEEATGRAGVNPIASANCCNQSEE